MTKQESSSDVSFPPSWNRRDDGKAVETTVKAKDFLAAVEVIQGIATIAEEQGHHPDIHLTGYNKLRIASSSHDVGRLTKRDVALVERVEALLREKGLRAG